METWVERPSHPYGRNYIETLLIMLTHYELANPDPRIIEIILQRLEEHVCAVGLSQPYIIRNYRDHIRTMVSKMYPDLPVPELKDEWCFICSYIESWLYENMEKIVESRHPEKARLEIKIQVNRICRAALLAALYDAALIPMTPASWYW